MINIDPVKIQSDLHSSPRSSQWLLWVQGMIAELIWNRPCINYFFYHILPTHWDF